MTKKISHTRKMITRVLTKTISASVAITAIVALTCASCAYIALIGGDEKPATPTKPETKTEPAKTTEPAKAPSPAGPASTILKDGTYLIGTDIMAGTYRTTVPSKSVLCYWARLKDTSGELDGIITNGTSAPGDQAVITIAATDVAFKTSDCGKWTKS